MDPSDYRARAPRGDAGPTVDSSLGGASSTGPAGLEASDTAISGPSSGSGSGFSSSIPSAPSLTLPKGGGAISGMGEKFDVNLNTGTASHSVPVQVSPGRSGMHPQLSLSYDSGGANGEFGLGWQLTGWQSITRKTSRGLPCYADSGPDSDSDVYLLSGLEDLVPLFKTDKKGVVLKDSNGLPLLDEAPINGYSVRRYNPRVNQSFFRIERWTSLSNQNDIHWRVLSPQNHTIVFGNSHLSRIYDPTSEQDNPYRIFSWLQSEEYDPHGNAMLFTYKAEDSLNVPTLEANESMRNDMSRRANRYLKSIQYGNTIPNRSMDNWSPTPAAQLPPDTWKFSVVLDYGEHDLSNPQPTDQGIWNCRPDPFSRYQSGFEIRTYRLCERILMFHHFKELGVQNLLVASTDLTYNLNPTATYLSAVQRAGYAKTLNSSPPLKKVLPPLEFQYSLFPTDEDLATLVVQDVDKESLQNLPVGLDGANYQWVDLDGEGLSGFLMEQDRCWYYKRNTSANNFDSSSASDSTAESGSPPIHARFGDLEIVDSLPSVSGKGAHFEDVAADGRLDLVKTSDSAWGFYSRDDEEQSEWDGFQPFAMFPNINTAQPYVKFLDLTGDGLSDILIFADQVYCWYPSLGKTGYGPAQMLTQPSGEDSGPVCVFADTEQTIYTADMSGDGLADIVRIRQSDVCYWPNCGYGRFGQIVRMDNAPFFDHYNAFQGNRVRLTDIDGSGTSDILYLGSESIDIYLNQSGNSFASRKSITSFPPIDNLTNISTVDLLGNGTQCIVWSSPLPGSSTSHLHYLDLTRGKKPHLLTKILNNLGQETTVHYAPSTAFYLQDKENGTPWLTRLPYPVHCVQNVEVVDSVGQTRFSKSYSYSHGYFDGVEREFRGFARVEEWDTNFFDTSTTVIAANLNKAWHVPPVHTKTWFHTGNFANNDVVSLHMASEYYGAPTEGGNDAMKAFYATLLPDTVIPKVSLEADSLREAYRSLKGHILRIETYGEDGSLLKGVPYSVQESNFTINIVQPLQDSHGHSVFTVQARESINYHYERQVDDARIQHDLTLQTDLYGNTLKSLKVAYGRQSGKSTLINAADIAKQETSCFTYTENDVTLILDEQDNYRVPTTYESRQYEVSGLVLPTASSKYSVSGFEADGFQRLLSLTEIPFESPINPHVAEKRLIARHRIVFRNDSLTGLLGPGLIQSLGIPGVEYNLWATPGLIQSVYKRALPAQGPNVLIADPKSTLGGTGNQQAGFVDLDNNGSWWKSSGRVYFHPNPKISPAQELATARQNFFQPGSFVDARGNTSTATLDDYHLFTVSTQDPVGNITNALVNYRVLSPALITDTNGNQHAVAFDAMGLVAGTTVMGRPGEKEWDSFNNFNPDLSQADIDQFFADPRGTFALQLLGNATTRIVADPTRFWRTNGLPAYQALISRETHVTDLGPNSTTNFQVVLTYSDGFGRAIQTKTQTTPGSLIEDGAPVPDRWITSSWTIFNNKGDPVRKYEPFFTDSHDFQFGVKVGVSPIMLYDPLSRLVALMNQEHSLEKTVFNAWSFSKYDACDNVKVSNPKNDKDVGHFFDSLPESDYLPSWHDARINGQMSVYDKAAAIKTEAHANTPRVSHLDVMGNVIVTVDDGGKDGLYTTRYNYDIQGHQLSAVDAVGRIIVTCDYSVAGDKIHAASMEAGETWTLPDVLGLPFLSWDSRGFRFRSSHDEARRPTALWMQENTDPEAMVQQTVYGELAQNAVLNNLRGRAVIVRDQAGAALCNSFDYKGNVISSTRILARNYKDVLDWSGSVDLESQTLTSKFTYDAKNRIVTTTAPDRSITVRYYDAGGYVSQILVNVQGEQTSIDPTTWTKILNSAQHNAKSQVTEMQYGNGVIMKRSYEPMFSHLSRILTMRSSDGAILQDLNYTLDAVGNITNVLDKAQQTVFFRNNRVDPSSDYTYDAVYRLVSATGREHLGQTNGQANAPQAPGPTDAVSVLSPTDGNAMGSYTETYKYDQVGNLLTVTHAGSDAQNPGWKRTYSYTEPSQLEPSLKSNRLSATSVGSTSETYTYDAHGNLLTMPSLPSMRWDFHNQLRSTAKQKVNGQTIPETTYYVYDSNGKRVRKVTESQAGSGSVSTPARSKECIYVDGVEIFRTFAAYGDTVTLEVLDLLIRNEAGPVTTVQTRTQGTAAGPRRLLRFQFTNYIGSATLEVDQDSLIISYEEFFPFGASAYVSVAQQNEVPKRYRYSGKEKDDENGLYYYGARYYASWLGRWVSADPGGLTDGPNLYEFAQGNPVTFSDPDGHEVVPGVTPTTGTPGGIPPSLLDPSLVDKVGGAGGTTAESVEVAEQAVEKGAEVIFEQGASKALPTVVEPAMPAVLRWAGPVGAFLFVTFGGKNTIVGGDEEKRMLEEYHRHQQEIKAPGQTGLPDRIGPMPEPPATPEIIHPPVSAPPADPQKAPVVEPTELDPVQAASDRAEVEKLRNELPRELKDKNPSKTRAEDWDPEWHHSIPQDDKLRSRIDKLVPNINDKENGRLLPRWFHKIITRAITKEWRDFFERNDKAGKKVTPQMVKDFRSRMDLKYRTGRFNRPSSNFHSDQNTQENNIKDVKKRGWLK